MKSEKNKILKVWLIAFWIVLVYAIYYGIFLNKFIKAQGIDIGSLINKIKG